MQEMSFTEQEKTLIDSLSKIDNANEVLSQAQPNRDAILKAVEIKSEVLHAEKAIGEYKKARRAELINRSSNVFKDLLSWRDKKMGLQYGRETLERNIYDIAPSKKAADAVIAEIARPIHENTKKANAEKLSRELKKKGYKNIIV